VEWSNEKKWRAAPRPFRGIGSRAGRFVDNLLEKKSPEERLDAREKTLRNVIRKHGPMSRQAAMGHQNLALELESCGQFPEARLHWQASLDAYQHNLGEEHPDTLVAEFNLALNLSRSGFARDAIPLGTHVYEVRKRTLQPDSKGMESANRLLHIIKAALESD
jgi:hypothetical protein